MVLKEWGKPLSGNKEQVLERVLAELQGSTATCPVTRGMRERVRELQTGRMTMSKAKVRGTRGGLPSLRCLLPAVGDCCFP